MRRSLTILAVLGVLVLASAGEPARADEPTKVFLNGVPTPVYFNDGDSFRVEAGQYKGTRARLSGFNTLESYGPVHQWGTWTREELSRYASLGTMNARRGVWRCTSALKKDSYGRFLWHCPDLAVDQVRKGLAHTMTVTPRAARKEYVEAQMEAIRARRGIWAHGVPDFVVTSLHSTTEGYSRGPYNRKIAATDGHSEKWKHTHAYRECQTACVPSSDVDDSKVAVAIVGLRTALGDLAKGLDDKSLDIMVREMAVEGWISGALPDESLRWRIEQPISDLVSSGAVTKSGAPVACMVYVDFKRRYGDARAECLQ